MDLKAEMSAQGLHANENSLLGLQPGACNEKGKNTSNLPLLPL